ncbi:MAG TPA: glycoside hydrolase family 95 protein [Tepidisphaeraceae bacterium]|nr:glycoside hydrolase family 95 protein [Tepidisphaeraceae bacterium]
MHIITSRLGALALQLIMAIATVASATLPARAAEPLPALKQGSWDALKLGWDKPATEDSFAGNPIGNGHVGARIKGGVGTEIMQLNDKWFWSGGPGLTPPDPKRRAAMQETRKRLAAGDIVGADEAAKGMWGSNDMGTFLPLGNLVISFDHADAGASGYSRVLDIDRAVSTVSYAIDGVTYTREAFASFPDDVIVVRLSTSAPAKLGFTAKLAYPPEMEGHGGAVSVDEGNVLVMKCRAPSNSGWHAERGMRAETRVKAIAQGGSMSAGEGGALKVSGADSVVLILAAATSYNGFDKEPGADGVDPSPIAKRVLAAAAGKGYDELLAAHVKDYQNLFRRVWVSFNGDVPTAQALTFQYARYDMIACSRTGNRPHNQQGMWNHRWKPSSYSAHWLNENVQKYYALIETGNLAECGEPLWNWMEELAASGAKRAPIDWGFKGWLAGSCSDIWAKTSLASGNNEWSIWPMGGVWLCQNLYDHYAFGRDEKFLRERAYPMLKGAAEFCLDYLVENKDGHLVTSPSTSPENRFGLVEGGPAWAVSVGATSDMALIRELFRDTIEASTVLGVDEPFREKLKAARAKLLPFKIGKSGELQEWSEDYSRLPADPRNRFTPHRHASHVISAWPLSQITERDAELFAAAKLALENRGRGGYHPDKGAMWARLKEGDKAIASNDTLPTGDRMIGQWPPKAAALPELLVQSHAGFIELLPALPTAWKSGRATGLRARGGYELSIEWNDGELTSCQIDSRLGATPPVRYKGKDVDLNAGGKVTLNRLATKSRS